MGKQFVPVTDDLTVMLPAQDDEGWYFFDAIANGWAVYHVFDMFDPEDMDGEFALRGVYTVDCLGTGGIETHTYTEPTVHCKRCGQRMRVLDVRVSEKPNGGIYKQMSQVEYACTCGAKYTEQDGWDIPLV